MSYSHLKYANFDIRIQSADKGYLAEVLDSPAGQAKLYFEMPFSALELVNSSALTEDVVRHLRIYKYGTDDEENVQSLNPENFGRRLYEAIFAGEIANCFQRSLARVENQGCGLRIRLRLEATELVELPWEYLCDPGNYKFFALSNRTPLVRYLELRADEKSLAVALPLRILVVIANPSNTLQLNVEAEWVRLNSALVELQNNKSVILEPLAKPTLESLRQRLRQAEAIHILHFIGHGTFDPNSKVGGLYLENDQGQADFVSAQALGIHLHDHPTLRLVFLNACKGASTSKSAPFAGTAQHLVSRAVPAVIAMQFALTDRAAIVLTKEFYQALADGYPVDAALAEARKALQSGEDTTEWVTPVLFMRSEDGHLFHIEETPQPNDSVQPTFDQLLDYLQAVIGYLQSRDRSHDAIGAMLLAGQLAFTGKDRDRAQEMFEQAEREAIEAGREDIAKICSLALAELWLEAKAIHEVRFNIKTALYGSLLSPYNKARAMWIETTATSLKQPMDHELQAFEDVARKYEQIANEAWIYYDKKLKRAKREERMDLAIEKLFHAQEYYIWAKNAWTKMIALATLKLQTLDLDVEREVGTERIIGIKHTMESRPIQDIIGLATYNLSTLDVAFGSIQKEVDEWNKFIEQSKQKARQRYQRLKVKT